MSKNDKSKQMRIKRKALKRQQKRKKDAILRKEEMMEKRRKLLAIEIRKSCISEIITPTFDRSSWGVEIVPVQSPVVLEDNGKSLKIGFDKDRWCPPV